jgi:hypothetical protein
VRQSPLATSHERRVTRRLDARGQPGLGDILVRLQGLEFGARWRFDSLYAVGAEGAVYLVADLREPGAPRRVAKVPLVPHHRPAELASSLLRHRRDALREESDNLARSASPYMPTSFGLFEFANPLLDARRGGAFTEPDPVLVMERLPGIDVDLWLARVHRSRVDRALLRQHLDRVVVVLLQALRDLQDRGFLYADLRPGNLRMIGRPVRRVRLLDAGSLVATDDTSGKFPHVPHYLPPETFRLRYEQGQAIVCTPRVQAVMAGRTLFEVATGCVPVPGAEHDSDALDDSCVSAPVADVVDGLASGSFTNVLPALKYLSRRATKRLPPPTPEARRAAAAARAAAATAAAAAPASASPTSAPPSEPPAVARPWWRRLLDRVGLRLPTGGGTAGAGGAR